MSKNNDYLLKFIAYNNLFFENEKLRKDHKLVKILSKAINKERRNFSTRDYVNIYPILNNEKEKFAYRKLIEDNLELLITDLDEELIEKIEAIIGMQKMISNKIFLDACIKCSDQFRNKLIHFQGDIL